MRSVALALAGALTAAASGGCGNGSAEDHVRAVLGGWNAALERHDGAAACARLSEPAQEEVAMAEGAPCAEAVASLDLSPAAVAHVELAMTSARARLADGTSVFLNRTHGGWRITAAGCTPTPDQEPYACELEV